MKNRTRISLFSITLIGLTLFFFSCAVRQNLAVSNKLQEGMTKAEAESIMGAPIKTDFSRSVEEWHYCKTGVYANEFIALFFHEEKLIAKKNYSVTAAEGKNLTGSCEIYIKMGNYAEPDIVVEIRSR